MRSAFGRFIFSESTHQHQEDLTIASRNWFSHFPFMPDSDSLRHAISRRRFFRDGGLLSLAVASLPAANLFSGEKVVLPFINGERQLATYPQKRPLILLTSRPPPAGNSVLRFQRGSHHPPTTRSSSVIICRIFPFPWIQTHSAWKSEGWSILHSPSASLT